MKFLIQLNSENFSEKIEFKVTFDKQNGDFNYKFCGLLSF